MAASEESPLQSSDDNRPTEPAATSDKGAYGFQKRRVEFAIPPLCLGNDWDSRRRWIVHNLGIEAIRTALKNALGPREQLEERVDPAKEVEFNLIVERAGESLYEALNFEYASEETILILAFDLASKLDAEGVISFEAGLLDTRPRKPFSSEYFENAFFDLVLVHYFFAVIDLARISTGFDPVKVMV